MRNFRILFFFLTVFLSFILFLGDAHAESSDNPSGLAVVDMQKVLEQSAAGKKLQKKLEDMGDKLGKEVKSRLEKLKQTEDNIVKQQSLLSEEAFKKQVQAFEKKLVTERKEIAESQNSLKGKTIDFSKQLTRIAMTLAKKMAEEKGLNAILLENQLVYFNPETTPNITQELIKLLDKEYPELKEETTKK